MARPAGLEPAAPGLEGRSRSPVEVRGRRLIETALSGSLYKHYSVLCRCLWNLGDAVDTESTTQHSLTVLHSMNLPQQTEGSLADRRPAATFRGAIALWLSRRESTSSADHAQDAARRLLLVQSCPNIRKPLPADLAARLAGIDVE